MNRDVSSPIPGHPGFDLLHAGDRVIVPLSGRTGTVAARCQNPRDGWWVRWDEPVFGVEVGRVATVNLERVR